MCDTQDWNGVHLGHLSQAPNFLQVEFVPISEFQGRPNPNNIGYLLLCGCWIHAKVKDRPYMQPQLLTVTHLEQSNLSLNLLPLCDAGSFYFRQCTQEFWLSGMHCAAVHGIKFLRTTPPQLQSLTCTVHKQPCVSLWSILSSTLWRLLWHYPDSTGFQSKTDRGPNPCLGFSCHHANSLPGGIPPCWRDCTLDQRAYSAKPRLAPTHVELCLAQFRGGGLGNFRARGRLALVLVVPPMRCLAFAPIVEIWKNAQQWGIAKV